MAALLVVPMNASAATTVNMKELHISIEIPTGWTYERNASSGGIIYDLEIQGPTSGGYQPYGLMDHITWPGSVSDSSLWAEMKKERDDMMQSSEVTGQTMISPAANTTINGMKCSDMTIEANFDGIVIRERLVILASDDWNMGWKLVLASVSSQWSTYTSPISSTISSLTVAEKTGTDMSMALLGAGILIVVIVVAVIIVVVMRGRKKPAAVAQYPPPVEPPLPPPPSP